MKRYHPIEFDIPFHPMHTDADNPELENRLFYQKIRYEF